MGQAVRSAAIAAGCDVTAVIERGTPVDADTLRGADVAIEFTHPASAAGNALAALAAGCPVVVGTTGWYADLDRVTRYAEHKGGALLWSANFSMGLQVLLRAARTAATAARTLGGFDPHAIELHHAAKLDAPSGTAIVLQREVEIAFGAPVPVTSIRVGHVPGTHTVVLDGPFEQIVLSHEVRDRRVFAEGAVRAAAWLAGRRGVFTLADMLDGDSAKSSPSVIDAT